MNEVEGESVVMGLMDGLKVVDMEMRKMIS